VSSGAAATTGEAPPRKRGRPVNKDLVAARALLKAGRPPVLIRKAFSRHGEFEGRLVSVAAEKANGGAQRRVLYRFLYSDGDKEDLYREEWEPLAGAAPAKGSDAADNQAAGEADAGKGDGGAGAKEGADGAGGDGDASS
jgi:hypothetical protein